MSSLCLMNTMKTGVFTESLPWFSLWVSVVRRSTSVIRVSEGEEKSWVKMPEE